MAVAEEDPTAEVCLEVFIEHYPKLIDALPVATLMSKFVSAKIVNFKEQDAIMAADTQQEKARRFLQFVAVPLESSKKTHTFRSMLKVVEGHGGAYAYLAKDIYKDLLKRKINLVLSEDVTDDSSTSAQGNGSDVPLNIGNLTELVIPSMATKWFEMGLQLGVDSKELKTIQHDSRDSKTACRAMFMEWLDTKTKTDISWKKVLTALSSRSVGRNTLAESLRYLE